MADYLDRVEDQTIARDEFFRIHKKSSSSIGSESLCISALEDATATCDDNCKDSSRSLKNKLISNTIAKSELKHISNDLELTSGLFVFNKDCPGNNSLQASINNQLKNGIDEDDFINEKQSINENSAGAILSASDCETDLGFVPTLNEIVKKDKEVETTSYDKEESIAKEIEEEVCVKLSENEECEDNYLHTEETKNSVASSDNLIKIHKTISHKIPDCNLFETCDRDEKVNIFLDEEGTIPDSFENSKKMHVESLDDSDFDRYVILSEDVDRSSCNVEQSSESNNFYCTNNAETDITIEIISETVEIKQENSLNDDKGQYEEAINVNIERQESSDKMEVADTKSGDEGTSFTELIHCEEIIESVDDDFENQFESIDTQSNALLSFSDAGQENKHLDLLNEEIFINESQVEEDEGKSGEADVTTHLEVEDSIIPITEMKIESDFVNASSDTQENTNGSCYISNDYLGCIGMSSQETETNQPNNCSEVPSLFNNSKCSIQSVPKIEESHLNPELETLNEQKSALDNTSLRSDNLSRTVKIGCLSVTPLNPCVSVSKTNENLKIDTIESSDCFGSKSKNQSGSSTNESCSTIENIKNNESIKHASSLAATNEKLKKNNVDITISPKVTEPSVSYSDAVETLKVKIPQLIESCTGKVGADIILPKKDERSKNLIVNKNLKVIESFLMKKGFQREANILKEKTDIIKPYLEDIALKLEKTMNEKNLHQILPDTRDAVPSESSKTINDYNKKSLPLRYERSVEKELTALTEKFLNSPVIHSKHNQSSFEDSLRQASCSMAFGSSNSSDKSRVYDRFFGRPYYEGLDHLSRKEMQSYMNRSKEQCVSGIYRSSRYNLRDCDYVMSPSEMSMYDQFLPEFDYKLYPKIQGTNSQNFCNNDFSLFIDEYTAEKYNNFIHFMVPELEAFSFDMVEYNNRLDSELNHLATVQPLDWCYPYQYCMPSVGQYPMPHFTTPTVPSGHHHSLHNSVSPAMGRPLPMDSSKESCSQLTITPLDECGKPYGSLSLPDTCSENFVCGEAYTCGQPYPPGVLPPVPPSIPTDSLSQQLTITPLHQSSNLPYLHRTSIRRRGRPPMDPDYGAVGYRRDAFANARFSRSDFLARVRSNIDSSYFDPRPFKKVKTNDTGASDGKSSDNLKSYGLSVSTVETNILSPTSDATVSTLATGLSTSSVLTKSIGKTESSVDSTAEMPPLSIKFSATEPLQVAVDKPTVPDLDKNASSKNERKVNKFIKILPKPSDSEQSSSSEAVSKVPFQMLSKQVKIKPNTFLPNSAVKISLVDKKPSQEVSKSDRKIKDDYKSLDLNSIMKKNIPGLKSVLSNNNISLKSISVSNTGTKKDSNETKIKWDNDSKIVNPILLADNPPATIKEISMRSTNNKVDAASIPNNETKKDLSKDEPEISKNAAPSITFESEPGAKKITPVKAKKRRRFPFLKKKKKKSKSASTKIPADVQKKQVKPRKIVPSDKPVATPEKSDTRTDSLNKSVNAISLSNINLNTTSHKESNLITSDSIGDSCDGIRRSGRKRKIIEGNPKFKDMERVDLKYFRDERMKPVPVKRKIDTKHLSKHDIVVKKKFVSEQRSSIFKDQKNAKVEGRIANSSQKTEPDYRSKEDDSKTKEKLQQFLEVNDIYLKPQTFV